MTVSTVDIEGSGGGLTAEADLASIIAMRATEAHLRVLERVRAFADLSVQERSEVLMFARERRVGVGDVLFQAGAAGDSLFLVLEGELSSLVRTRVAGAKPVEVSRAVPGEMIGEMACLDPAPRSALVIARTACVLAEIDRSSLAAMEQALPRASSRLVGWIIELVHARMAAVNDRVAKALAPPGTPEPSVPPPPPPAAGSSAPPPRGSVPVPAAAAQAVADVRSGFRSFIDRLRGSV